MDSATRLDGRAARETGEEIAGLYRACDADPPWSEPPVSSPATAIAGADADDLARELVLFGEPVGVVIRGIAGRCESLAAIAL
ncbi:hypothetical protein ACQEU6_12355 [Spirillospora sp. CA-108201]